MLVNLIITFNVLAHALNLSVTEAKYDRDAHTLECSVRIFTHDLEHALNEAGHENLNLGREDESPQADSLIGHLVLSSYTLVTDKGKRRLVYIGREFDEDGTLVHFRGEAITPRFKWIETTTSLLVHTFPDQRNIVHVTKDDATHTLKLDAKTRKGTVIFQE
ncbi:MAG: hypothetical protein J4F31_09410 [Flavobacteriales bacterium]|nr:hypothetical protein [Flavobacteriales bacterium]